jgi:hypothetical protein
MIIIKIIRSINSIILPVIILLLLCGCDDKKVILDEEYLTIRIKKNNTVHVHVRCIFRNTADYCSTLAFPVTEWFIMDNFSVTWNGENCISDIVSAPGESLFLIDGRHYKSVYRYNIPCSGSDTSEHIITYSYRMPFASFMKEHNARGRYLEYILHTGGLWHGNVSKLRVEIISETGFLKDRVIQLDGGYSGKVTGDGRWVFNADNIELQRDIRLLLITDSSNI